MRAVPFGIVNGGSKKFWPLPLKNQYIYTFSETIDPPAPPIWIFSKPYYLFEIWPPPPKRIFSQNFCPLQHGSFFSIKFNLFYPLLQYGFSHALTHTMPNGKGPNNIFRLIDYTKEVYQLGLFHLAPYGGTQNLPPSPNIDFQKFSAACFITPPYDAKWNSP